MYKTVHGTFNGDSWEDFCQICFKKKYESEGYQEMPAWQGDLGIEGFTRTGILFQCYCPDEEYAPDDLYDKQRDKITNDLKKLIAYQKELKSYLKTIKVKQWIFVTPGYKKKDIVRHCQEKAEEYKKLNLSILDPSFDVLIYDIGHFATEIPLVLDYRRKKIEIVSLTDSSEEEIEEWKEGKSLLVDNALRKHGQRLPPDVPNREKKIDLLTNNTIEHSLDGDITLSLMATNFPEDYEKFLRVVGMYEKKVKELCVLNTGDNNLLYARIESELNTKLREAFGYIEQVTIDRLTEKVLANWILDCPINFD